MLKGMFNRRKATAGSACSEAEGPCEQTEPAPTLPLDDFVAWLVKYGPTCGLTRDALWLEYGEFCLWTNTEHLTKGQFFRRRGSVGIERYREPVGARRWLYRVRLPSGGHPEKLEEIRRLRGGAAVLDVEGLRKS